MPRLQLQVEVAGDVPDVGDAARHAGGEVAAGRAQDDGAAAGHVLAAVVADAFDHGPGAAVADTEPFGRPAAEEGLAAGRAVQHDVADQDVVFRHERCFLAADRSISRPPDRPLPT